MHTAITVSKTNSERRCSSWYVELQCCFQWFILEMFSSPSWKALYRWWRCLLYMSAGTRGESRRTWRPSLRCSVFGDSALKEHAACMTLLWKGHCWPESSWRIPALLYLEEKIERNPEMSVQQHNSIITHDVLPQNKAKNLSI